MRIPIREQLAALVLLTTLTGLAVVSIATWITNYNRVISLRTQHLGLTASLKASQLSSNLDLMERSVRSLATRVRLQTALQAYNEGNNSFAQFQTFGSDLQNALATGHQEVLTLQAVVFPNKGAVSGLSASLLNTTGPGVSVELPYDNSAGRKVYLGDADGGYPPNLYPNLTFTSVSGSNTDVARFDGEMLALNSSILLGPWQTNESFALVSITLPVLNNTSDVDILGWMTVVLDARLISSVLNSPVGLQNTGTMLLVTPNTLDNRFHGPFYNDSLPIIYDTPLLEQTLVRFALPPDEPYQVQRHSDRSYGKPNMPFNLSSYPVLLQAIANNQHAINNAGGKISTLNEENYTVSIGYAVPESSLCTWALVLEQAQSEVWIPINQMRRVILGCILGTVGGIILLVLPIAHYSSRPIRRLRDATAKSLRPVATPQTTEKDATGSDPGQSQQNSEDSSRQTWPIPFLSAWAKSKKRSNKTSGDPESLKMAYPIPQTVEERKHFIQDELTDLTQYFNEMSDELVLHYGKLEERVRQRTAELETSKKAAEAANESKTLFIANISHELKTPLNGILGMCAVCMQEDDPARIKRSLEIIYKSGDLLHNLLTDLLTFSKNEVGQQLTMEEREFYLRDVGTQIKAIFENQANEGQVNFTISYEGPRDALGVAEGISDGAFGPLGTGRVKDMCLWGDYHRILQVVINLVSNSLKFTPAGGSVRLKIRCCQEEVVDEVLVTRRSSDHSSTKSSKRPRFRILSRSSSDPEKVQSDDKMSLEIRKRPSQASGISDLPMASTANISRTLRFEFEVEDTGPGIPEHLQRKIFEPFVQGDLRLTKKFGGTGLGLSICQQLAKLMNGSVDLKSEEGFGSRFTFQLPLKHIGTQSDSGATSQVDISQSLSRQSSRSVSQIQISTQQPEIIHSSPNKTPGFEADSKPRLVGLSQPYFSSAKPPMSSPSSENGKKESKLKVLVAEDNTVNQEVVLRMLRLEEIFDVHLAKDGQEALDKVKESMEAQSPYDLVLMDVQMPILDGRQSTRLIREAGYSAPIVALTAFADEVNKKECMDSGMDYFLAKPIRRPALKHVLKTYCGPILEEADEGDSKSPLSQQLPLSPSERDAHVMTPKTVL